VICTAQAAATGEIFAFRPAWTDCQTTWVSTAPLEYWRGSGTGMAGVNLTFNNNPRVCFVHVANGIPTSVTGGYTVQNTYDCVHYQLSGGTDAEQKVTGSGSFDQNSYYSTGLRYYSDNKVRSYQGFRCQVSAPTSILPVLSAQVGIASAHPQILPFSGYTPPTVSRTPTPTAGISRTPLSDQQIELLYQWFQGTTANFDIWGKTSDGRKIEVTGDRGFITYMRIGLDQWAATRGQSLT